MTGTGIWSLFFSWPNGGTWSNMIASGEWVAVAAGVVYLLRDFIGKRVAAWWHRHHEPHLIAAHLKALEQYAEQQLRARRLQDPKGRMRV